MNRKARLLAVILIISFALSGCGGKSVSVSDVMSVIAPEETPIPGGNIQFESAAPKEEENILNLSYQDLDGVYCPLFAETDGDRTVAELTQLAVTAQSEEFTPVTVFRVQKDDGSTEVTFTIADGVLCSDGQPLTADDLLFDFYVMLDSSYDGPKQLNTIPIRGLSDYWNGMNADLYTQYMLLYGEIYNNGTYDEVLQKALEEAKKTAKAAGWKESSIEYEPGVKSAQAELDAYDTEKAEQIREGITNAWMTDSSAMVDYTIENYSESIELRTGLKKDDVLADRGLQVAYTMLDRGIAQLKSDGSLYASATGTSWNLQTEFPAEEDLYNEFSKIYNGDVEQYFLIEGYGREDLLATAQNRLVCEWASADEAYEGPVTGISGIQKNGQNSVKVILEFCNDELFDTLCDFEIAPLHVYGDMAKFMPGKDLYGFVPGDLSDVLSKAGETVGAGAYVYNGSEGRTLHFLASGNSCLGAPEADRVILAKG